MVVKVKNLNGTSDKTPSCGCSSWIEHWMNNKPNLSVTKCRACGDSDTLLGGHVKIMDCEDRREYIIPICSSCNNTKDKEFFTDLQNLVLANSCSDSK